MFIRLISLFLLTTMSIFAPLDIDLASFGDNKREPLQLLLAVTPSQDKELTELATLLSHHLQRSGQFKVTIKGFNPPSTQSELLKLLDPAYPLELFLSKEGATHYAWRLYDVHDAQLIKGVKYAKKGPAHVRLCCQYCR